MFSLDTANPVNTFFIILSFLVLVGLVISIHEASHAYIANLLGDPTAKLMGRMTLNPIAHIDPIGTILLPFILLIVSGLAFGWAKPTPVNPLNFRHPFRDSALVAFAGPVSNFLLAVIIAFIWRIFPAKILVDFISINLLLGLFNLIPIPPLDGYKIALGFLPKELAARLMVLETYGSALTIVLLFLFLQILSPFLSILLGNLMTFLLGSPY